MLAHETEPTEAAVAQRRYRSGTKGQTTRRAYEARNSRYRLEQRRRRDARLRRELAVPNSGKPYDADEDLFLLAQKDKLSYLELGVILGRYPDSIECRIRRLANPSPRLPAPERTHCLHGHKLTPENSSWVRYFNKDSRQRQPGRRLRCKICQKGAVERYRMKNPDEFRRRHTDYERSRRRAKGVRASTAVPWTHKDVEELVNLAETYTSKQLAEHFGRTVQAIRTRLCYERKGRIV